MDYFAFFGLPRHFFPDQEKIRRAFLIKSRQLHPDYFSFSLSGEKQKAEELAGINNQAYQTLLDEDLRLAHLLDLEDVLPEEGKAQLPQAFLMDMMEVNEALMELEFDPSAEKKESLRKELDELDEQMKAVARPVMERWDMGESVDLQPVVDYYMKKRYVRRLQSNLEKMSS
jgi:molecular chaperone HscB